MWARSRKPALNVGVFKTSCRSPDPSPWWQTATIYRVSGLDFQDSDGDGVGDLRGLASRLSYLAELEIDCDLAIADLPFPDEGFRYDISNYVDIDPMFRTMADFDTLLVAAHEQGLRLLLNLVPNHTSDQHPWFVESRSSRRNARREWYLWRDQARMAGRPTIGYRNSAGAPGSSMPLPNSTTITPSLPSSPT